MPGSGYPERHLSRRNTVVAAIACALLAISQSVDVYVAWQGRYAWPLALMLPTWALMAACWPLLVWLARTYTFAPQNRARSAVVHVTAGLIFALVHNAVLTLTFVLLLAPNAPVFDQFAWRFRASLTGLFYQDVLIYVALLAMYLTLHYADLRAQLADARLTALRAQLNPHFFFNTLNAVSTLALQGRRDDVAEIVGRLGDLMRTALDEHSNEVRLSAEVAFVDDYLAIQRVRFGDRFQVHKKIAPETLDASVPSLVLQPILENAVEYAVAGDSGSTSVKIEVSRRGDDLFVEVSDTGPGFALGGRREGIGLANTRARLQELYGNRCRFEYGNLPGGGASVRMSIPFRSAAALDPSRVAGHEYGLEATHANSADPDDQPRMEGRQTCNRSTIKSAR
jgi:two-component system LytT family sensor kinase